MGNQVAIFWHRRDLRIEDNAGLWAALKSGYPVIPIFIFDRNILDVIDDRSDARVGFIHETVGELKNEYEQLGGGMEVIYASPLEAWQELFERYDIAAIYTNRDYEPYALERDDAIRTLAAKYDATFHDFKDHIIFEADEVQKKVGGAYTVFTPYKKTWLKNLESDQRILPDGSRISFYLKPYPTTRYVDKLASKDSYSTIPFFPSLEQLNFKDFRSDPSKREVTIPPKVLNEKVIRAYNENRDYPSRTGTSRLGIHLRHGTLSIRQVARQAQDLDQVFLSELIWRDFYSQVLQKHPRVVYESFRPEYEEIEWLNDEEAFTAWCAGKTGYPLVDAGMRELNRTGFMHNRIRMLTASFLTKHLLTDWRWGEQYFADRLLDYELASNNGGWQWAAGCGTDAAPYFRIFNPTSQLKKFDKDEAYVRAFVEEYDTDAYPEPIVEHKAARERALEAYKSGLKSARS